MNKMPLFRSMLRSLCVSVWFLLLQVMVPSSVLAKKQITVMRHKSSNSVQFYTEDLKARDILTSMRYTILFLPWSRQTYYNYNAKEEVVSYSRIDFLQPYLGNVWNDWIRLSVYDSEGVLLGMIRGVLLTLGEFEYHIFDGEGHRIARVIADHQRETLAIKYPTRQNKDIGLIALTGDKDFRDIVCYLQDEKTIHPELLRSLLVLLSDKQKNLRLN